MRDLEGKEQADLFRWLHGNYPDVYRHAFHVPNGGHRHVAVANKLKQQGVKAGVPDIFIMMPRGGYHGLVIEFKASPPAKTQVSANQKEWLNRLASQDYLAVLCRGIDAAKQQIQDYLTLPENKKIA
ncbi:VRR-NUC domain-containing protein [Spartinivicinus ruber]|uniref:VRR-NUC domain-containing protein n=1 Tax=Spartinivicinus ruber TaxID=2683272 RepID=UPI0013D0F1F9|nr:VRR-NUC domain-containing protein [Spartinivicinus ruber]